MAKTIAAEVILGYLGMLCKWKTVVLGWFSVSGVICIVSFINKSGLLGYQIYLVRVNQLDFYAYLMLMQKFLDSFHHHKRKAISI